MKSNSNHNLIIYALIIWAVCACKSYKQNILYSDDAKYSNKLANDQIVLASENYKIQVDDLIEVEVYSQKGERIIDPDNKLTDGISGAQFKPRPKFLVRKNGFVNLPMVGEMELAGLTLHEANQKLSLEYAKYYVDPYVLVNFANKRIVILGANGGQVIPLENQNTTLIEVISLAGGLGTNGKANSIKVLRNGQAYRFDLSTLNNWEQSNFIMESGDIVYIEPIRKPIVESVRDISPLISLITSVITLVVLVITL